MCVLVLSCRTGTPPQLIDEVNAYLLSWDGTCYSLFVLQLYGPRTVTVPKMPSLGLLLEYPIFESYNARVIEANGQLESSNLDFRPVIDFEIHRQTIDKFKQEQIYSRMRASEERNEM